MTIQRSNRSHFINTHDFQTDYAASGRSRRRRTCLGIVPNNVIRNFQRYIGTGCLAHQRHIDMPSGPGRLLIDHRGADRRRSLRRALSAPFPPERRDQGPVGQTSPLPVRRRRPSNRRGVGSARATSHNQHRGVSRRRGITAQHHQWQGWFTGRSQQIFISCGTIGQD